MPPSFFSIHLRRSWKFAKRQKRALSKKDGVEWLKEGAEKVRFA
jgi:hypothetical protein